MELIEEIEMTTRNKPVSDDQNIDEADLNTGQMSQPQPNPDVELYKNVIQIIDTVSQRGAFRGEELLTIGVVRQNLVNKLEVTPQFI